MNLAETNPAGNPGTERSLTHSPVVASESVAAVHPANHFWAELCLVATAVMWGINIPIVKDATLRADKFVFNALRLTLAMVALGVFAWLERRGQKGPAKLFSRSRFVIFSLMTGFFYMILFMLGVSQTTSANVALILSSMPMWTAILSFIFIHERLKWVSWLGLGITFAGTLAIIGSGNSEAGKGFSFDSEHLWGNLMIVMGAMMWAGGTLVSKKLLDSVGPMKLAFMSSLMTTPMHLMIAWSQPDVDWTQLNDTRLWLEIVYSGIFSTGLAYAFWHIGVRQLGGSHASGFQNLVTLVAVSCSWIFLREKPMFSQILGGLLVIAGILVMRRGRK